MTSFLVFAFLLVLILAVSQLATVLIVKALLAANNANMELLKATSLAEKVALEAQREEKRALREVYLAEEKERMKKPPATSSDIVLTTEGSPVDMRNLVPDFL